MSSPEEIPFFVKPIGFQYSFYLTGPVRDPSCYVTWFQAIREATENDVVFIHINSPGGSIASMVEFLRVLRETSATVVGSLEGEALSAAGAIFLACDQYQISPFTTFMAHNYSGMSGGKGGEMFEQISYERRWSADMLHTIYGDFLTSKEITSLLENKDIWLSGDEVGARLDKKLHADARRHRKMVKEMSDANGSVTRSSNNRSKAVGAPAVQDGVGTERTQRDVADDQDGSDDRGDGGR